MKAFSRSLSSRSLTKCSAPATPLLSVRPTSTTTTTTTALTVTSHSRLVQQLSTMPPRPRRKPAYKGAHPYGNRPKASDATTPAAQPSRPTPVDAPAGAETIDVKHLYSTAAGDMQPEPYSSMQGKLDPALLQGLDKMGFE